MRLPYVIKKTHPGASDTNGGGTQVEIPGDIGSEIQHLRRQISEFQAAAVRERRSEETLRASEERFRKIFEEGPLGMAMSDPFLRFIRANAAFCRMLGYTEKEITSLTFKDITHPDYVARDAGAITKLLKGNIPFYRTEKRYIRKDQGIVWGQVTVSAIRDAEGGFQYFLAMIEDITAGKQACADLVQGEQKSKELADALPSGIFETDIDGHLLFANRTAYEWFGYAAEDLKAGLSIGDFLVEKDRARAGESLRRVLNSGEMSSGEYTAKRKDGLTFPVLITARKITKNGGPPGLLGTVINNSERVRTEKELRENEEKYRMLFESANDAIFLMDTDQFVDCNSNTLEIFGCGRKEDIVGHPPWDFSPARQPDGQDSKDKAREFIAAALSGKPQRFFWLHCRKDGTPFDAEVSLTSLVLGGKTHLLAVVRDITDRTQADRLQNAVYRIAEAAHESADLNDLYKSVHETVRTVMPASNFYIALYDAAADLISFPYFVDEVDAQPASVKPRKGLTEYIIRTGKPLLCDEATDMGLRSRGEVEVIGAPSAIWLGVPLIVDKKTTGVMVVQHYSDPKAYGPRELRMLEYVSSQVAKSIEHKRTEEALRKNEQRLSLHIQQTPLGVIEWDTAFRVRQWNLAAERIFGFTAVEAIGRHAAFIVPDRFKRHVDLVWGDLLAKRGGERSTNENMTKDGRAIFCEWYNTSLVDREGGVIGVASLVQDVTERRRVEEALRDSEELHRKLLSSIPDMIIRTDLDGKVLFANDVAVRAGGFSDVAGLVGQSIFSFVSPEDLERAVTATKIMFEKSIDPQEYHLVLNGGQEILYEINGAILRNPEGAPYGMVFLCRDITDRKQAETDLHQSLNKLRSTLKASIDSLASAIEMRDPYTAGHQERVTRLATAIAREMHVDEERIEGIQIAGIIHDIGKLYVPAEILSKPTKLSELEYSMIKMHAQVGYTILSKIDFPWPIAQIVHQHHENINGSGYPRGLAGKDILLEAKILCVADVVEAMSSHRPYRPALGIQAALEEISLKRGILYDREVVDACLRIFSGKTFKFD